jgi:hypothetical protein
MYYYIITNKKNINTKMTTQTITQPTAFFIDSEKKRMYYNNTDLFNYNQMFYYGCKVKPKTIVIKKNIPETEYLYANLKKGDWNLSSPECKKAQLLISKEWVDKYYFKIDVNERRVVEETVTQEPIITVTEESIPVTTQDPTVNIVQEPEEIVEAPRLLLLDDNEKFKDADGNIIEIETRGTKDRKSIYFKLTHVSKGFDIKSLSTSLLTKDRGYERNIHYKTFLIKTNNNANIKSLYLTYYGFLKVISTSRINSNFFTKNINIITKWLDYLINNKYCDNYILSNVNRDLSGVIYICSSPLIDCIKIGYWTGSITGLKSRYKMVYGKDVLLKCKNVENVRDIEKKIHYNFKQFNISGELFQKDKLQLYIDYLNNHIVEYLDRNFKEDCHESDEELDNEIESNNDEVENEPIEEAPGIIHLNDNEKFRDTDGNIVEIETRGTKNYNNIYFKLSHVSKGFNMTNLKLSILKKDRGYNRNVDYKTFLIAVEAVDNVYRENTNKIKKPSLYLTYSGLLRVLFVSRNKNVERFQDWAMKTLFTIQMGSTEERVRLGTSILNIPEKTYKAVFKKHANKFPCIYLLSLGNVGVLRKTFGIVDSSIPDDSIIYKYGFTDDLGRRMGEHEDKYGKLENVKIVLSTFHIIDPKYTCDAEGDIREECNAYEIGLQTEGYNELIVLNKKQLEHVKKNYGRIGRDYAGHTAELQEQIVQLKYELERLKTTLETNEKFKIYEIKDKEKEIERLKTLVETNEKIKKLEIENLELQIKILTNNK